MSEQTDVGTETTGSTEGAEITEITEITENTVAPTDSADVTDTGQPRNHRKTRQGYVVSEKMDKTAVVEVEDRVKHPLYGKVMRRTSKVKAHDEQNSCGLGDRVLIMETRPLSATKRWRVVQILERAK
ncbi:MAG: 30S ribosomal protein S17 [Actinomycetales bacterium]|nr:MAG: 30S ribosomal protein S17 [Actinomycetales bacterium]